MTITAEHIVLFVGTGLLLMAVPLADLIVNRQPRKRQ